MMHQIVMVETPNQTKYLVLLHTRLRIPARTHLQIMYTTVRFPKIIQSELGDVIGVVCIGNEQKSSVSACTEPKVQNVDPEPTSMSGLF